jgi:two-component sensor histidine kinase
LTLLSTATSLLLAWLLATRLIRSPIVRMLEAIEGWRAGRGTRTGLKREQGELAALGASLDELMDQIDEREARQQLTSREMLHRLKNALAVVQALSNRSFRHLPNAGEALAMFGKRISTLARAYNFILTEEHRDADLETTIRGVIEPFDSDPSRFALSGPKLLIPAKAAFALTLIFHELATNAVKYGALSNTNGKVAICWEMTGISGGLSYMLTWQEQDGPDVAEPDRRGYGSVLIDSAFSQEFASKIERRFEAHGLFVSIAFVQREENARAA